MTSTYTTDITIFGGGIAGLWLLNRLQVAGYQAILLDTGGLGEGQTLASQGIIHGGLKYALSGTLSKSANTIAGMPERWRQCLAGEDEVDLSGCRVLSDSYYMWSDAGIRSKLKTFFGSKSLQGRVESLSMDQFPPFFQQSSVKGSLYKLPDFVVDTKSLLQVLSSRHQDRIFDLGSADYHFEFDESAVATSVFITSSSTSVERSIRIKPQRFVFTAGKGNQSLIEKAKLESVQTQLRPLKMTYLKSDKLPEIFVHCIGDDFSLTPKLTVTSHTDSKGLTVWYLGGELAESGVGRSKEEQIQAAKTLLMSLFPWISLQDAQWNCFDIDRAEADINNNYRPDDAFLIEEGRCIAAWPTKLTLSPSLADKLIVHLEQKQIQPSIYSPLDELRDVLGTAALTESHWETDEQI